MVDSTRITQMKEKNYNQEQARNLLNQEINRLRLLEGMDVKSIIEKLGVSRSRVYKALTTFEQENPQQVELMKNVEKMSLQKTIKSYERRSRS